MNLPPFNQYFFTNLIYSYLHICQNTRMNTSLISTITFVGLNHFLNELYVALEEKESYDLQKKKMIMLRPS